jgi:DNA-binding MarR family transcriptional regulator
MSEFLDLHGRTSKLLRALSDRDVRKHGLHFGQDLVLSLLWAQDGQTPGEIATTLNVTTPTIVKMATRMGTTGLLTRVRDSRDNRLVRLWLTDKGRSLRDPVEADRAALENAVTSDLTADERACLIGALKKIRARAYQLLQPPADTPAR